MDEVFKNLQFLGFPNYEVSNLGNARSLSYAQSKKPKNLKPIIGRGGYLIIHFSKDGKQKGFFIHRLVAKAFIPNPNELPEVNHIDEDKTNNRVSNLMWCTPKQNSNHGTRNERIRNALIGRPCSEETKIKIAMTRMGDANPMKREDVRKKNSEAHKGKPSPKRGIPLSEETKQKIRDTKAKKRALCQRCHNSYDAQHRAETRKQNR